MTGPGPVTGWELVDDAVIEGGSPGQCLRAARVRVGLSLSAVAAELKVPPRRLEELEADEFASFGPPVFVRGYLRRYAVLVGLPPEEVLELYEEATGGSGPVEIGLPPGKPPRPDRSGWVRPVLATCAIAAVLAGGWWLFAPPPGSPDRVVEAEAPDADGTLALEPPVLEEAAPRTETAAPAPETLPAVEEPPTESGTGTEPVVSGGEPSVPEAAETVADSLGAQARPETGAMSESQFQAGQAEIRIELDEDCWMEIVDAEGRRLAYRLGRAGQVTRVRGTVPISVFLGNAEGVKMTVDGEPVAVRPAARRDGTARLTVGGGAG